MLQRLFVLFFTLAISSSTFGQVFSMEKGKKPLVYRSFGSYVGEVGLQLFPNDKFVLYFHDFDTGKTRNLKGKWTKHSKEIYLQFKGKPNLDELFARNKTLPSSSLKFISDHEIQFSTTDQGFFIWGIFCTKE